MKKDACVCLDMIMTGKVIRNMIMKRGFTIKDIQQKLNLSCPQPIYRWLNGQTLPSLDNLYMLSGILEIPMEELLMPRNDKMWLVHISENKTPQRRIKFYFGAVNHHE